MKNYQIILSDKKNLCENTYSFTFDTSNTNYNFKAGQYAHFTLADLKTEDEKGNARPFSIASSPGNKDSIMIAARKGSSVFIDNLLALPLGSKVFVSEPSGDLILDPDDSTESVFIAGGIGITPVRSIIEFATANQIKNKITLFYSNDRESQTAFLEDFEKWANENPNFKFIPLIENPVTEEWKYKSGKINSELLRKHLGDFENKHFYIIGPPVMVEAMKEILLKERVDAADIKTEKFN